MVVRLDRSTLLRSGLAAGLAAGLESTVDSAWSGAVHRSGARGAGVVARGIDVPWNIRFLPGHETPTALVSSRDSGKLLLVSHRSVRTVGHFAVVSRPVVAESGLLGLALHPEFATNRLVYAYVSTHRDNRVVRFTFDGTSIGRPHPVLTGIRRARHHNGGGVAFGPDGMLYVSTGENEIKRLAQDKHSLNGKILRVTDTGATPPDNRSATPSGATATATPRASPSTSRAGCGPRSSATTRGTRSTRSTGGTTTAGRAPRAATDRAVTPTR